MSYPESYDTFTDVKVNGDVITESVSVPASTTPTTINVTYVISQNVSIPGYTEVVTTPATNQFKVTYESKSITIGPTPSAETLTITYTTKGMLFTDIPYQGIMNAIETIEQALGLNPNGSHATIADRILALEAGTGHTHETQDLSAACDGVNLSFAVNTAPSAPDATQLILNGTELTQGVDYTMSGATINMEAAPESGDTLIVHYIV